MMRMGLILMLALNTVGCAQSDEEAEVIEEMAYLHDRCLNIAVEAGYDVYDKDFDIIVEECMVDIK